MNAPPAESVVPPHDELAESAVLADVILGKTLPKVRPILAPSDFYFPGNRWLYRAACEVESADGGVDSVALAGWLRDCGKLDEAGGAAGIAALLDKTPATCNVEQHARLVLGKARLRRLISTAQRLAAEGYAAGDADEYARHAVESLTHAAGESSTAPSPHRTPAERALTVGAKDTRLPTSVKTLDEATRGGLPTRKRVFVIGPPGSGKTTWCASLALQLARAGVFVSVFAADEDADSIFVRWGQGLGIDRDELERGEPSARQELHDRLSELPNLDLWDVDVDEDATVESVAQGLANRRGDAPSVLFADSIQTLAQRLRSQDDNRLKVDAVVALLKRAARVHGHLVIATSEAGRGYYAQRNKANRSDALAAGKESSGIEYGGDLQLVFSSVKDESGVFDVEVPKNRLGPRVRFTFRLQLHFRTAQLTEVQGFDAEGDEEDLQHARMGKAEQRVLEYVRAHLGASKTEISRKAGGNFTDNDTALAVLEREGRVERRAKPGRGGGVAFWPSFTGDSSKGSDDE